MPGPSQDTVSQMRALFSRLDSLSRSKGGHGDETNRLLIMREFGEYFEVQVDSVAADQGSDPVPLSPARGLQQLTDSSGPAPGITWDPRTTATWSLQNNQLTATMRTSSSWRTLQAADALPRKGCAYFTVSVHALRTLAVGISQGEPPQNFVGDSSTSWGYQSTGHLLHGGTVVTDGDDMRPTAPGYASGDTVGVLVDPKQRSVAFYKNGRLAGMPFIDIDVDKSLHIAVSTYLGPCTFSVDPAPLGDEPTAGAMLVPAIMGFGRD
eukprot:TRINITY_DN2465_c0_g1_i1.p1 TRINITY_DN2465_c0_g1~~TRINITY_DN2465_c0_g1_i1.p1  ORF type:complete len:289 (+),score=59.75 TRINITY_DN2465_c0_g1_i1:70-867(+)